MEGGSEMDRVMEIERSKEEGRDIAIKEGREILRKGS